MENKKSLIAAFICILLIMSGCYSLLPITEVDNGIPEDSRTWRYFQIIWKPGEKPKLESLLRNYYSRDCNPGCVYEYVLTVNLIEELSEYQVKKMGDNIPEGSSILLGENDTCGSNYCKGTWIPHVLLLGDLKEEIRNFDGKKRRIPVNVNQSQNPMYWNYFRIHAKASDDTLFTLLQDDLNIQPYLENYAIVVNIADINPLNQYIVIGDDSDPGASRWAWSQISKNVQNGLINWTKPNKENFSSYFWR